MQTYQGQGRATECVLDQAGELWKPFQQENWEHSVEVERTLNLALSPGFDS